MDSLRIISNPLETEGGYGVMEYWRVSVNGTEVTPHAKPFAPGVSRAILNECLDCYRCSNADLSIRRCEDAIVWFGGIPENDTTDSGLAPGIAYAFDAGEYEKALGGGSTSRLPKLTDAEIQRVLAAQGAVDPNLDLYTIPELPDDQFGLTALHLVADIAADRVGLQATPCAPSKTYPLRIGLELPDIPECTVEFGRSEAGPAIRLCNLPTFPLWLTGNIGDSTPLLAPQSSVNPVSSPMANATMDESPNSVQPQCSASMPNRLIASGRVRQQ